MLLSGCAAISTTRDPAGMSYESLCEAFGNNMRSPYSAERVEALAAEIAKRGYINPRQWESSVMGKKVQVGMSRCALYASWGTATRENQLATRGGVSIQHVFGTHFYGQYIRTSPSYAYTVNDVVTAVQP